MYQILRLPRTWLLGAAAVLTLAGWLGHVGPVAAPPTPPPLLVPLPVPPEMQVFVTGAVQKPGVYTLPYGSRVSDAIAAAGGYSQEADPNRLPDLAKRVRDGATVRVVAWGAAASSRGTSADRVNVNTADAASLMTIPQMTLPMALDIVNYRQAVGVVRTVGELQQELGLDAETWRAIKPWLTTGL